MFAGLAKRALGLKTHPSLYSHRDVFLRELISNANDALEKLRLTSLTDKEVLGGAENMNITIKAYKDEDGNARLVIRDTGIGMTPEELTANLVRTCYVADSRAGLTSNPGYACKVRHV